MSALRSWARDSSKPRFGQTIPYRRKPRHTACGPHPSKPVRRVSSLVGLPLPAREPGCSLANKESLTTVRYALYRGASDLLSCAWTRVRFRTPTWPAGETMPRLPACFDPPGLLSMHAGKAADLRKGAIRHPIGQGVRMEPDEAGVLPGRIRASHPDATYRLWHRDDVSEFLLETMGSTHRAVPAQP